MLRSATFHLRSNTAAPKCDRRRNLWLRRLAKRLQSRREFLSLQQDNGSYRTVALQLWDGAHDDHFRCLSLHLSFRLSRRIRQLDLCLVHRRLLRLGVGEVVPLGNRLDLGDSPGLVIDNDLEKLSFLCRIDRKLELALIHLKFSGDRLAFPFAGREGLLQGHLYTAQRV